MKKKTLCVLGIVVLALGMATMVNALTFTFQSNDGSGTPNDFGDLDHGYAYKWGLDWQIPIGEQIVGASLFFDNIRNWQQETNDLWVHLLNSPPLEVTQIAESASGDYFAGKGILLDQLHNLSSTAQDITVTFDPSEIATLIAYITNDGRFGFGFDPECHFYNDGITLTIQTRAVPEPAMLLLLGCGLLGLAGVRRKISR